MIRSPPLLRSSSRGKVNPPPTTDKKRHERSLSTSSAPEVNMTTKTDKQSKFIEELIGNHLSRDDVFSSLVERLSTALKTVVEEAVQSALVTANQQIKKLSDEVTSLQERVQQYDEKFAEKCDELEQYQRRDNLRVFGVPEKRGENTDTMVLQLFKDKLGVDLPAESLSRSHRVGQQSAEGRHRPIIVKFSSYRYRRLVFDQKKKLKGTGVTVREDLTAARQRLYQEAVVRHGIKNTWTNDGRILWMDNGVKGVATRMADLD